MNKTLIPILLFFFCSAAAQNTQVVVNAQSSSEVKQASKDDTNLGGVSSSYQYTDVKKGTSSSYFDFILKVSLTNGNSFPVTCDWHITSDGRAIGGSETTVGSVTLQSGETQLVYFKYYHDYQLQEFPVPRVTLTTKRLANGIDEIAEMKKFKELLDAGIITKEEFDKKKKELLGL